MAPLFAVFCIIAGGAPFAATAAEAEEISRALSCPPEAEEWYISLSYHYRNPGLDFQSVSLTFDSAEESKRFSIAVREGAREVRFYDQRFALPPERVTINDSDMWFALTDARCDVHHPFPTTDNSTTPAVIDSVTLRAITDFNAHRESDFLIYRWDYFPQILIFDTKNYSILNRLFNRIAFFIEKDGHVGTLRSDAELAGITAWNGHNYNADDIANFFNAVAERQVTLNSHEERFKSIMLTQGIITAVGGGRRYRGGDGGILAISQQSPAYTRQLILQHELLHGIFYSSEDYRSAAWEIWDALSPAEQRAWRRVLTHLSYDGANEYVVVNEFQAYLLAKPQAQSSAQIARIARALVSQGTASDFSTLLANGSQSLTTGHQELSRSITTYAGLRASAVERIRE